MAGPNNNEELNNINDEADDEKDISMKEINNINNKIELIHNKKEEKKEFSSKSEEILYNLKNVLIILEELNCLVDVREGLQTFLIYVSNIIKYPNETKYRKIRIANANYHVRLGHLKNGQQLLECVGFKPQQGFLVLNLNYYGTDPNYQNDIETNNNNDNNNNDTIKDDSKPVPFSTIKKIRDIVMQTLEEITKKFENLPRHYQEPNYEWKCVRYASEGHSIGRRQTMEDDHLLLDKYCGDNNMGFFGLYDGHGGRATVDFLTCSLYLNLMHYLKLNENISMQKALNDVYEITDKQIHRQQIYQSGATAVNVILRKEGNKKMLHVANAGDTRAVLCRNGNAIRLTKDHKADDKEEANLIKKRGGRIGRFKRVNGLLAVTRAFGDHLLKPPITVKPQIKSVEIKPEDHFMVICCDGVWDVMKDEEVIKYVYETILKTANSDTWLDVKTEHIKKCLRQICLDIIKTSMDRRSQDNISVVIVCF